MASNKQISIDLGKHNSTSNGQHTRTGARMTVGGRTSSGKRQLAARDYPPSTSTNFVEPIPPLRRFSVPRPPSPTYSPLTPPHWHRGEDIFAPTVLKPNGEPVRFNDSALKDKNIARAITNCCMLPLDQKAVGSVDNFSYAIDRALQFLVEGLLFVRRAGELQTSFAINRDRIISLTTSGNYQNEVAQLRTRISFLESELVKEQMETSRLHEQIGELQVRERNADSLQAEIDNLNEQLQIAFENGFLDGADYGEEGADVDSGVEDEDPVEISP